ncbi:MAG: hypothetical protein ACRCVE_02140 [Plesiomonas sp.]
MKLPIDQMLPFVAKNLNEWPTTDNNPSWESIGDSRYVAYHGWSWIWNRVGDNKFAYLTNGEDAITFSLWITTKSGLRKIPIPSGVDAATAIQPAPSGSGNPILGMVLADLTNRALEGKEKYGEPLKANNGRKPLWDAYQEALDLCMYLRQMIEEQKQ